MPDQPDDLIAHIDKVLAEHDQQPHLHIVRDAGPHAATVTPDGRTEADIRAEPEPGQPVGFDEPAPRGWLRRAIERVFG